MGRGQTDRNPGRRHWSPAYGAAAAALESAAARPLRCIAGVANVEKRPVHLCQCAEAGGERSAGGASPFRVRVTGAAAARTASPRRLSAWRSRLAAVICSATLPLALACTLPAASCTFCLCWFTSVVSIAVRKSKGEVCDPLTPLTPPRPSAPLYRLSRTSSAGVLGCEPQTWLVFGFSLSGGTG